MQENPKQNKRYSRKRQEERRVRASVALGQGTEEKQFGAHPGKFKAGGRKRHSEIASHFPLEDDFETGGG